MRPFAQYALALACGYLATTFTLWFAHWFAHLRNGPLTAFHLGGHHALYESGTNCSTATFNYATGRHSSVYAFIPWLAVLAALIWWALPRGIAITLSVEATLLVGLSSYIHEQFHTAGSPAESSKAFMRARERHFQHHDRGVNFAVFDHFWDILFGTFAASGGQ